MKEILLVELIDCIELCERLEQLLQQDIEDFPYSVTGEICDVYTASTRAVMQSVTEMKQEIMLLHSYFQTR